jgi:hypothetical protein
MTDPTAPPTPADVRDARARVDELRRQLADAERVLRQLLEAVGRRPGDGSDQPELFESEAQPRLWCQVTIPTRRPS